MIRIITEIYKELSVQSREQGRGEQGRFLGIRDTIEKIGTFFDVQKWAGETYPLICPIFARLSVKEGTRRERGSEPGLRIVYKWILAKKTHWVASG